MSDSRYVFTNDEDIVVQAIDGNLSDEQLEVFMNDYSILFQATSVYVTDPSEGIMAGWKKIGDDFVKPSEDQEI